MASREEKNKFSMLIMQIAQEKKIDHMDAITTHCENTNLEIEVAAKLVNDTLRGIIENEAIEMKYLPQRSQLPL